MNKIKWSDILHDAADKYLSETSHWICSTNPDASSEFSCDCIIEAAQRLGNEAKGYDIVYDLEDNFGLNTGMLSFEEFEPGEERQGARYAWLKFAAMYYEEHGN